MRKRKEFHIMPRQTTHLRRRTERNKKRAAINFIESRPTLSQRMLDKRTARERYFFFIDLEKSKPQLSVKDNRKISKPTISKRVRVDKRKFKVASRGKNK